MYKILLIAISSIFSLNAFQSIGQVYESEELRLQVEKDAQKKSPRETTAESEIDLAQIDVVPFSYLGTENYYKISKIEVVNIPDYYSASERTEIENEGLSEYQINDFLVDLDSKQFIIVNRTSLSFRKFDFQIMNNELFVECATCNFPPIKIHQHDGNVLHLDFPNQDEGKDFVFRFIFTK
ncbi:MAG: hypothetical protein V4638_02525 [Bacteroidota bacterium]